MKFCARAGAAGAGADLAGTMPYGEGHIVVLPNVERLDEPAFFEACAEYRYKRQGTTPPNWAAKVIVPGLQPIEATIADLDGQIAGLQNQRQVRTVELEERAAYR